MTNAELITALSRLKPDAPAMVAVHVASQVYPVARINADFMTMFQGETSQIAVWLPDNMHVVTRKARS